MSNVLIACEESQTVCIEFRKKGHNAFSCDLQQCSGNHPEWHFYGSVFDVINGGNLVTQSGEQVYIPKWDLMIGHPPCTYLSYVGNAWLNVDKYGIKAIQRHKDRAEALEFFYLLWTADIDHICLENPRGYAQQFIKHSQIIQPYYFGDSTSKTTLLWLKNLPPLLHSKTDTLFTEKTHVDKGEMTISDKTKNNNGSKELFDWEIVRLPKEERSRIRSKTFPGIARALAEQYGSLI